MNKLLFIKLFVLTTGVLFFVYLKKHSMTLVEVYGGDFVEIC